MKTKYRKIVSVYCFVLLNSFYYLTRIRKYDRYHRKSRSEKYYFCNDTGVRYSYLIPHTVPYRGLAIPYRTVSPYFFFFNTVSSRYGTVRYDTILVPRTVSLWCRKSILKNEGKYATQDSSCLL
jgi:hypothetical protein